MSFNDELTAIAQRQKDSDAAAQQAHTDAALALQQATDADSANDAQNTKIQALTDQQATLSANFQSLLDVLAQQATPVTLPPSDAPPVVTLPAPIPGQ